MFLKLFLPFLFSSALFMAAAQKPIRKGMPPIQTTRAASKAFYSVGQLTGKWQEIKRTPINAKEPINFSDTLLMQFDSNKVEIKDAISMRMTMKGDAYIDAPYNLFAAGDEYIIRSLNKDRLVLDDGANFKELCKKDSFYYETLGKLSISPETLTAPINVEAKNVIGKWMVYRRQAVAGSVESDAVVIKSLDIFPSNTIGSALGKVVCYQSDVSESLSCKIVFGKGNILVITDKYVWEFITYKADGKEFVFGEVDRLVYYAKR